MVFGATTEELILRLAASPVEHISMPHFQPGVLLKMCKACTWV